MGKFIDMVGLQFGRLTVIELDNKNKRGTYMWKCKCSCELQSIVVVNGASLRFGSTKSCGCIQKERTAEMGRNGLINLTGMRFGRLEVINIDKKNKWERHYYLCKCDCDGKEILVLGASLKAGHTKSCGCLAKELSSERNKKYNTYDLSGEYGVGFVDDGKEFYFDKDDFELIQPLSWHFSNGYILSKVNDQTIKLHRFVINDINETDYVDHVSGVRHDCRKENLRVVKKQENAMNRCLNNNNTSGHKGIQWHKQSNIWRVDIQYKKKRYSLGCYHNKEDAIRVREIAELLLFKEYSRRYHELKEKYANEDTSDVEAIIKKKQESIQDNT